MEQFYPVLEAWPLLVFAAVSSLLSISVIVLMQKSARGALLALFCAFSAALLGAVVGYITGLSRVGVAGQLVSAALSFVGVGAAYIFLISEPQKAILAAATSIAFGLSVGSSTLYSASLRNVIELKKEIRNEQWKLRGLHVEKCLSFILSEHYAGLSRVEKTRVRLYCSDYVEFLK